MNDIVYLFKESHENDSEELRYSLRSLQNLPHGNVFIVGEKPAWVTNVRHITVAQSKTKSQNVGMNLSAAVQSPDISDDFVLMNDDFFIMKKIETIPNLNFGDMKSLIQKFNKRYPQGSEYITRMTKLYHVLREQGYDNPISYELHVPTIINKRRVLDMYNALAGRPIYQFRTYYGNYFDIGGESIHDAKVYKDQTHSQPDYSDDPTAYLERQTFLSTTGGSFRNGIPGAFIRGKFPQKSQYEI